MPTDKTCLIISGGDFTAFSPLWPAFDYVIACDRGYGYACRYGIRPDIIIGDFDSSQKPDTDIPVAVHPVMKDDTDTMLAVRHALEKGFTEICICCAMGSRFDHTFANIQALAFAAVRGAVARIFSDSETVTVFSGREMVFERRDGWSLSCFSLSDSCRNVSVSGTKFVCSGAEFTNAFPLGVSNVWEEEAARISCDDGILMVVQSRLKNGEHI